MPGTSAAPLAVTRDTDHSSGESGFCRWNLSWLRNVITVNGTAMTKISAPAVQLTGVQLLSALLPQSDFPAGFKLDKSNIFDSGRHFENSPAQYHLSTMSCSSFSNDFGGTGFGETATAADDFTNSTGARVYGQQVYQFKTGSAATSFFKGLRAISRRCRAFLLDGFASGIFTQAFGARSIGATRHSRSISQDPSRAS